MYRAKCVIFLIAIAMLFSCSAAGGGGGGTGTAITLYSEPALDGYVRALAGSTYDGSFAGASVSIGDDASGNVIRCVVSFDMSGLPAGAQIDTATLRMYQNATATGSSYPEPGGLGSILVTNYAYSLSTTWADLFNSCTTGTDIAIGPISSSFSPNTWHELDVTTSAYDEVNSYHNGRLQFLVFHHIQSNGGVADSDGWVMGDSPTHRPELVIKLK